MRKRWKLLVALGCAALAVTLLLALPREHEPTAHGKPLSDWVKIYSGPYSSTFATPKDMAEGGTAIKQIGTNAIPFLLRWMDYETPPWKATLFVKSRKLPKWIINIRPAKWLFAGPGYPPGWSAALSFRALGPTAAPAIHELEIRAQRNSPQKRSAALFALSFVGPEAVPAMVRVFSNPDLVADTMAGPSLGNLGTNARPLITLLVQYLDHTNAPAAAASAAILGHLWLETDLVIPALMRKLGDPRASVSNSIPLALAELGYPALVQLTNALSNADPLVRQSANNAIAIIAAQRPAPARPSPFE